MDLLSIVILNFNGRQHLEKFLPAVVRYCEGHRVYVVDNGSVDNSCEYLFKNFPTINVISFSRNEGFAGGYNLALAQIESEYYLLLNSDVEITRGWISPLLRFMESRKDCAASQPRILAYHQRESFEYAGAAGGYLDILGYPFCRGRIFNTVEADHGQYDDNREIFWASGACMMVRSEAFHSAGGFDASFFAHMEEIDLCWRLKKKGWKIYYVAESRIYHLGGGTLSKSNPHKTYLNFRNNLFMLIKNLPGNALLWIFPLRFFFDMVACLKFLFFDSSKDSLAVLKAYCLAIIKFRKYRREGKSIKTDTKNSLMSGFYSNSILLDYFLKGRKRFSDLRFQ